MIRTLWKFNSKNRPFYSILVKTNKLNAPFIVLDLAWNSLADNKESDKKILYEINSIRNSCSIVMRKGINANFGYNYSIYTKAEEQRTKK